MQKGIGLVIWAGMCLGGHGDTVWPIRAGDRFAGFAVESARANDPDVMILAAGTVRLPVAGVSGPSSIGSVVYAIHDDSFTLTAGTGRVQIGHVLSHIAGSVCVVAFDATEIP